MVVLTNGVAALGTETVAAIFAAVAGFTDFNPDNDPWDEHDCAVLTVNGIRVIWKIDYLYEESGVKGADGQPQPTRVLTLMLADDW